MEAAEEESLFRSYPYAALYFVQSPSTTVSHHHHHNSNQDIISFHSPATQRRLTLSHYSSSRGSTTSFLHDKKVPPSPDHDVCAGGGEPPEMAQDCHDFSGGKKMEEEEEEEEEEEYFEKKRSILSFKKYDSWVWIWFQISLRVMVSFGVALMFFYLITKPPPPIISIQMERINAFQLGEGVDNTGVTTKFLTCNCSINLQVDIKSLLFGLHIHPPLLTLSFNNLPLAVSHETKELYASSNGPTTFVLYLGTRNKPMYGAGRSMQDILESRKGLPLMIRVTLTSSFHVVWKLISPKFHHRSECLLVVDTTYDRKHGTLMYKNHCKML